MFRTALLLQTCNQSIFGDHCKYSTFRRWVTTATADSFFLLHLDWITAVVCVEVGEMLYIVFGIIESDCSEKKNNHENPFMLSSSTVWPACLENFACQWMLQMPYKKGFCFLNWTLFVFGLTCITKHCVSSVSFKSVSKWVPSKVQFQQSTYLSMNTVHCCYIVLVLIKL